MPGARGAAFRQAPRVGVPLLSRDGVGIEVVREVGISFPRAHLWVDVTYLEQEEFDRLVAERAARMAEEEGSSNGSANH